MLASLPTIALLGSAFAAVASSPESLLSFKPPYMNHDFHNENYHFGGNAVLTKSGVELTGDYPGQRGWLVSRNKVLPDDFQVEIDFHLFGAAKSLYGDGLAVWFLEGDEEVQSGPIFGVQDKLKGTALVIDTYRNHRPGKAFPYLVLSQNDGTRAYDIDNDGLANELAAASLRGIHNPSKTPSQISIEGRKGGNIVVKVNYRDKWETVIDMPFNFNGARRLALSASTGQLASAHVVSKIQVTQLAPLLGVDQGSDTGAPVAASYASTGSSHTKSKKKGSWLGFFFKIFLFGVICVGGKKLWKQYQRKPVSYLP